MAAMAAFHRSAPRSGLLVGAIFTPDVSLRALRAAAPLLRALMGIAATLRLLAFAAADGRLGRSLDVVGHDSSPLRKTPRPLSQLLDWPRQPGDQARASSIVFSSGAGMPLVSYSAVSSCFRAASCSPSA